MARLRPSARLTLESAALGLLVGTLVVLPWVSHGYLLLLDWVSGPHQTLNAGVYGLSASAVDAMPFRIGTQVLRAVVGPAATAWLLVLAYFPLAAAGASMLAGGSRMRRHAAALAMVCNPFVVDRVRAGHVAFLLGVALLPWLFRSALHARAARRWVAVRPAGWFALAMAMSPHAFWLGGAILVAVGLLPRPTWRDVVRTLQVGLAAGLVYAYGAVVYFAGIRTIRVTDADLSAYATASGPGGLLTTLLGLGGFWRDFDVQVRTQVPAVVAVVALVVLVGLVVVGATRLWARVPELGLPLVAVTATGLVLASGVSGPFAPLYRLLFRVVPLFEAMREQQKWLALTVIGFAVALGAAAEWVSLVVPVLVRRFREGPRHAPDEHLATSADRVGALAGTAVAAVVLVSAPALLWGLGGTVSTSDYPAGWYAADEVMGSGEELALFLPWHGYQPFAFTDERSVATPAEAFFRRPVLSSDAVELAALRTSSVSLRQAYVDQLVAAGGAGTSFGRLVAPLGVRYVVVSTEREADRYTWVEDQRDLRRVVHTDSVDLYEVLPTGTGRVVSRRQVAGLDGLRALLDAGQLGTEAVTPAGRDDGPLPSDRSGGLRRTGSTSWEIAAGDPGFVVVPEEYSAGWRVDGRPGEPTLAGTVAFPLSGDPHAVEYAPWRWLRLGLVVSLGALLVLLVLGLVEHRAEVRLLLRRRHARPPGAPADGRDAAAEL